MNRGALVTGWLRTGLWFSLLAALLLPVSASALCVGDCDSSGLVTQDDLDHVAAIALATENVSVCTGPVDYNNDGDIEVNDVIVAVGDVLCGVSTPTPTVGQATPTPTPTGTSATVTPTLKAANNIAGGVALVARNLTGVTSLVTAIARGFLSGGSSASVTTDGAIVFDGDGGAAGTCPMGGTVMRSCSGIINVTFTFTFDNCQVAQGDGSLTIKSGTLVLSGLGACPKTISPFNPATATVDNLVVTFNNGTGDTLLTVTANLTANISSVAIDLNGNCFATGATFTVSGTLHSDVPGMGSTSVTFTNTSVVFAVDADGFSDDCAPQKYGLLFNGAAAFSQSNTSDLLGVSFDALQMTVDSTNSPAQIRLTGGLNSTCFGGEASLLTETALAALEGQLCPTAGKIHATVQPSGQMATIFYSDSGVTIDSNGDGLVDDSFMSCLDEALLQCPQP